MSVNGILKFLMWAIVIGLGAGGCKTDDGSNVTEEEIVAEQDITVAARKSSQLGMRHLESVRGDVRKFKNLKQKPAKETKESKAEAEKKPTFLSAEELMAATVNIKELKRTLKLISDRLSAIERADLINKVALNFEVKDNLVRLLQKDNNGGIVEKGLFDQWEKLIVANQKLLTDANKLASVEGEKERRKILALYSEIVWSANVVFGRVYSATGEGSDSGRLVAWCSGSESTEIDDAVSSANKHCKGSEGLGGSLELFETGDGDQVKIKDVDLDKLHQQIAGIYAGGNSRYHGWAVFSPEYKGVNDATKSTLGPELFYSSIGNNVIQSAFSRVVDGIHERCNGQLRRLAVEDRVDSKTKKLLVAATCMAPQIRCEDELCDRASGTSYVVYHFGSL